MTIAGCLIGRPQPGHERTVDPRRYVLCVTACVPSCTGVKLARPFSPVSAAEFSAQCAVLGLRTVRSVAELNAAYRPLIRRWHPDRHVGTPDHAVALERAQAMNAAYAFLLAALESLTSRANTPPSAMRPATTDTASGFPDPSVLEIFVKPSGVMSVGYNSATAELYVKYLGHRTYRYTGVPPAVFEALLSAPSASTFVTAHIDRQYASERIP